MYVCIQKVRGMEEKDKYNKHSSHWNGAFYYKIYTLKTIPHSFHWLSCHDDVLLPGAHVEAHDLHSAAIKYSPPPAAVPGDEALRAGEKDIKCVFVCGHALLIT